MYNNPCCSFRKSNDISFNKAVEELKLIFKIVDNVMFDKHGKSFGNFEYKPKKVQLQLTNMIVYVIEISKF